MCFVDKDSSFTKGLYKRPAPSPIPPNKKDVRVQKQMREPGNPRSPITILSYFELCHRLKEVEYTYGNLLFSKRTSDSFGKK